MKTVGKSVRQYENGLEEYSIDISEHWLLVYWSDALGVTVDALVAAAAAVGTNLNRIDAYLVSPQCRA
jgi:hypothetical protein